MNRFKIVVFTQVLELKGSRWAGKGGNDWIVARISLEEACKGHDHLYSTYVKPVVDHLRSLRKDGDEYDEYMIDWSLLDIDEPTPEEATQLKYEGRVLYPAKDYPLGA